MAEEESTNNVSKQSQLRRRDSKRARKVSYPTQFEVTLACCLLRILDRIGAEADDPEWVELTRELLYIAEPSLLRRNSGSDG